MLHPSCFTPRKETQYPLYRRLGGPQGQSGLVEMILQTIIIIIIIIIYLFPICATCTFILPMKYIWYSYITGLG